VAAAALANARTFGGQDYIGYHTLMALVPAYEMALTLPEARRALPVFKVLYRKHQPHSGQGRTQERDSPRSGREKLPKARTA